MPYLLDLWPLKTVLLEFLQKIQDGRGIEMGRKTNLFTSNFQKFRFFTILFNSIELTF
jgi:hypothetical protein